MGEPQHLTSHKNNTIKAKQISSQKQEGHLIKIYRKKQKHNNNQFDDFFIAKLNPPKAKVNKQSKAKEVDMTMMKDPNQTASSEELSMTDEHEGVVSVTTDDPEASPTPPTKTTNSLVKSGKTLTFSNVNMTVKETTGTKNKKEVKQILYNVNGEVVPGKVTAIMGERYV